MEKMEVTKVNKTGINDLIVCILFCVPVMSPVYCRFPVNRTEEAEKHFRLALSICMPLDGLAPSYKEINRNEDAPKLAQQTPDIKLLAHVGAIKNEMIKPTNGIGEILYGSDRDSGTDTKPFKTAQTGREKFSDIAPKAFAPP
jgi:hypothetical protein